MLMFLKKVKMKLLKTGLEWNRTKKTLF